MSKSLIVQKYGGTSVGTLERIEHVAERIVKVRKTGVDIVVVVSAMAGETDKLLKMARSLSKNPARREVDMLFSSRTSTLCPRTRSASAPVWSSAFVASIRRSLLSRLISATAARGSTEMMIATSQDKIDFGNIPIMQTCACVCLASSLSMVFPRPDAYI